MYLPRNPPWVLHRCIYSFDFILGAIMMDFHERFQDCWWELPLCNGDDRRWHISSGKNCWKEVWSRQRSPVAAVEPRIGGWELYGLVVGPKGNPLRSSFPFPMAISGVYTILYNYKKPIDTPRIGKSLERTLLDCTVIHTLHVSLLHCIATHRSAFASSTITTPADVTILEASRHWVLCF